MSDQTDTPSIQQLRDRADQASDLEKSNAQLARENAFLKAGVNPEDPKMGYFMRGYEGELDTEAIKTAATEAGFLGAPAEPTPPPNEEEPTVDAPREPSDEQQLQDQLASTVPVGSAPMGAEPQVDLMDQGFKEFHTTLKSGAERKDAAAHVIGRAIAKGIGKE